MPDRLLTTKDIQDLLHLDRVTIYKLVKDGELPARRVGGQWRFPESAVQSWLQDGTGTVATSRSMPRELLQDRPSTLTELIPVETLQAIQNQFAHLLGVASFTIDRDGEPFVTSSRCSEFCQLVHSTAAGFEACCETWRQMAASPEEGAHIHRCHAGIQYASVPLIVNGERMGMVTAGQFLTEEPDPEALAARARETGARIGVEGHTLAVAARALEIVHADRALQITSLLATIATTLSAIGYQSYLLRQKLAQIAQISGSSELPAA